MFKQNTLLIGVASLLLVDYSKRVVTPTVGFTLQSFYLLTRI